MIMANDNRPPARMGFWKLCDQKHEYNKHWPKFGKSCLHYKNLECSSGWCDYINQLETKLAGLD